jgi:GNAT superfamily N-acetyltransferase
MSGLPEERWAAPQPLSERHILSEFESGEPSLDYRLQHRALTNQSTGGSRTYVLCAGAERVIGYYCLSASSISHRLATGSLCRNMPDPVPMMLIGRLAVDREFHGRGLGAGLLKDAVLRTAQVAVEAGVRGLLVHAVSEDAKRFYAKWNFVESPVDRMTLMIRLVDLARTVQATGG